MSGYYFYAAVELFLWRLSGTTLYVILIKVQSLEANIDALKTKNQNVPGAREAPVEQVLAAP